jgi:hypothetical protein
MENDVDSVAAEPGAFVETTLWSPRQLDLRNELQPRALRRCSPEREFEQHRLAEPQAPEAFDAGEDAKLKARPPRGRGSDDASPLRALRAARKDASIEGIETRSAPPPAG